MNKFETNSSTLLENLPQELLQQKRFFPVYENKEPMISGWNDPANQMTAEDALRISKFIGMDIRGHGQYSDLFFADFDHVTDKNGNFIYPEAEKWYNCLKISETFRERSISKEGCHVLFNPTPNKFPKLTGDNSRHAIYFDKTKKGKHSPKIELFYLQSRYVVLTGDCEPNLKIVSGEVADEFCQHLVNQVAFDTSKLKETSKSAINPADISIEEVQKMLAVISCVEVSYADWWKIGAIIHDTFGANGFEIWRAWSETDKARYTLETCQKVWSYLDKRAALNIGRPATIGTLIFFAKKFGYKLPKRNDFDKFNTDRLQSARKNHNTDAEPIGVPDSSSPEAKRQERTDRMKAPTDHQLGINSPPNEIPTPDKVSPDENYFNTTTVAKIIGVTKQAVEKWRKKGWFNADMIDHAGVYYYTVERVLQLKSVYRPDWQTAWTGTVMADDIYAKIRNQCKWSYDKYGRRTKIKSDVFNYKLIFEQDPNLNGLFGRDNFRQEIIFLKRAPWHDKNLPLKDTWDDTDDAELRLYQAEHFGEMGTPQRTLDFVIRVARENSFHAIRNFFEGLPEWDEVERAESIFIKFLGAEDNRYTREITMHFLFGAIARALYPGCDFQSVVVIQGAQGIGKSRLLRMLGGKHGVNPKGDSWHIALRDQLDDSHAVDAMRKGWLVEIEEFAAASRADVNSMKGVLSADDVTRRFAYERHAKTIKAHWIFAATCNDDAPLRDQTGNRRFLPIKCTHKESTIIDGMTPDYIRHVWAEAYHKFMELFPTVEDFDADKLRLPPDLQAQAAQIAEGITQDDGLATEIKGFLDKKIPPLAIWNLLTREERRKFFVESSITLLDGIADLNWRARAKYGRNTQAAQDHVNELDKIFSSKDTVIRKNSVKRGDEMLEEIHIYGTEERQHICAAEIFNECFGQDNRKRMQRINETLARIDGWYAGKRLRHTDPAYPDQKNPYYRN